jgi:hypothetical protein
MAADEGRAGGQRVLGGRLPALLGCCQRLYRAAAEEKSMSLSVNGAGIMLWPSAWRSRHHGVERRAWQFYQRRMILVAISQNGREAGGRRG